MRKSQEEAAKKQRKQQMAEIAKRKREAGKGGRFGGMSMAVSYFFFKYLKHFSLRKISVGKK
jgi:hypothetical protein